MQTLASVIGYSLIDKQGMSEFHRYSTEVPLWRAVTYYLMENSISQVLYGLSCLARFPHQQIAEIGQNRMEANPCYCPPVVDLLFTHPLRFDDRKGQLRDRGSAVFCHFRCFARWVRLERNLHKTPLHRRCCDGIGYFFDSIPIATNKLVISV